MFYFIVNPVAGSGNGEKAGRIIDSACSKADISYKLLYTEKSGHATVLAQECCARHDCLAVIAVGGDGTVNETLAGMDLSKEIIFGVIPAGTGNDFNMALNKTEDISAILEAMFKMNTHYIDYMNVSRRRCVNVASLGFDVDVLTRFNQYKKRIKGKIAYYLALARTVLNPQFRKARVTCDGDEFYCEYALIAAGNGICYGGGIPVTPEAVLDDGCIDLCIIKKLKRRQLLPVLLKFLHGDHVHSEHTIYRKCKSLTVRQEGGLEINTDGEIFNSDIFTCSVEGKLLTFKPPSQQYNNVCR